MFPYGLSLCIIILIFIADYTCTSAGSYSTLIGEVSGAKLPMHHYHTSLPVAIWSASFNPVYTDSSIIIQGMLLVCHAIHPSIASKSYTRYMHDLIIIIIIIHDDDSNISGATMHGSYIIVM